MQGNVGLKGAEWPSVGSDRTSELNNLLQIIFFHERTDSRRNEGQRRLREIL